MDFSTALQTILETYGGGLNPGLWLPDGSLLPEVRNKLNIIANDFCEQHVIPSEAIEDITLTGSMANFNWSDYSDIDLHVVVNFDMVDENSELLNDYYQLAKSMWNSTHDIKICEHEVEVYIQDSREPHHSTGIYSITSGKWIVEPAENTSTKPNMSSVQQKAEDFIARIDKIERMVDENQGGAFEEAEKVKDRIKTMRKAGLESAGEFSIENLVFKYLRNNGHLDRLSRLRRTAYDDQFTVNNCETEPDRRNGIGEDVDMKLRSFNMADTIPSIRIGDTIAIYETEYDPNRETDLVPGKFDKSPDGKVSGKDIVDAANTLDDLDTQYRAGKNPHVPLDFEGRLELALRDSKRASDTAMWSAKEVNQLRHDMNQGFGSLMSRLDQMVSGEKPEPEEPGASIWDDE